MPLTRPYDVDPADEQLHRPDSETLWNESYYLDFVTGDGALAGYVRIGLYPNLGVTWWTTMVVGPDRPVTASVAYDLSAGSGPGLVLDSKGVAVSGEIVCPLETMRVHGSAPAIDHAGPAGVYQGDPGRPTTVGLDLSWTTDGVPYHYGVTTRYEIPCLVNGEVTVGGHRFEVVGQGQRDHSWGVRDWWAFGWCWAAARLDDGTRLHVADIRIPGSPLAFGYIQPPGGGVLPVSSLSVSEELGDEGMPRSARMLVEPGGIELDIRPVAFGPLVLTADDGRVSRFPRAAATFAAADGRTGTGWIEWNQPEHAMPGH
ncbi:MAG TPA: hypothetical protein VF279_02575 [Acidimicrobiales bacterium]